MNILEIIVIIIIGINALKGLKDGLIVSVCSLFALFLAIIITQTVSPIASRYIQNNETCISYVSDRVEDLIHSDNKSADDESEISKQEKEIDELPLPSSMKEMLKSNNNSQSYTTLGVENFEKYLSYYIACALINCVCYILVFFISVLVLRLLINILNLMSKLPVIHTLNKLGGFGIGCVKGLIIVWLIFVIITICSSASIGNAMYSQIEQSEWLKYLYDNNLIMNAIIYVMSRLI